MTYKIEQFVRKIASPIKVKIDEQTIEFTSGKELAEHEFNKNYVVKNLFAEDSRVIIELSENERINDMNWIGEEPADFF